MEGAKQIDVILFLFVGMLALSLLAGAVVLFFFVYQKKMLRHQLDISEMEKVHREDLLHSNIEQVETERQRIAADLHDELGSIFSTLKLKINQIGSESAPHLLSESRDIIDAGINSVRRISHEITPPGLEMFGLADALEGMCAKANSVSLRVDCSSDPEFPRLSSQLELGFYRIAQELLNNSIKHSGASRILLHLGRQEAGTLYMEFSDNGKGFDPAIFQSRRGLGLKNIEARANYMKANIEWITAPGQGLKTIISIPPAQAL